MKLCWDNVEELKLTKKGDLRKGSNVFIEVDACVKCGEPFLTTKAGSNLYCSKSCAFRGKPKSKEHVEKMRLANLGRKDSIGTLNKKSIAMKGENNPMYGKKRQQRVKDIISKANYKGGFSKNGLASYTTYANQISYAEDVRSLLIEGVNYLEVKCTYCNKWYVPKAFEVRARKNSLCGKRKGESLFYCSEECKDNCPIYHKQKYQEGLKITSPREVDPYIRKLCFERDLWQCQKCYSDTDLHCHHIKGYAQHKLLANDIDNCITLCKKCHMEVHTRQDCRFIDLKCVKEL